METGGKGEEQEKWKSIKVKEGTREELRDVAKDMGVGIGKAVEMLVEARQKAITTKIEDIEEMGSEIADILLKSGLLDIKFKGAGISTVSLNGDCIIIHGFVNIGVPDEDAREEIFEVLKRGLEGETE